MGQVLAGRGAVIDWYPYGYDERQYGSPGFDLPVGRLSRSLHGSYPQYHTSADDLDFVSSAQVLDAVAVVTEAFELVEERREPLNLSPRGEPQLGRRGLFTPIGGTVGAASTESTYLWILALADGRTDLAEIAARADLPVAGVVAAAGRLRDAGLLSDF
jgi:aminopeptidase-like protein